MPRRAKLTQAVAAAKSAEDAGQDADRNGAPPAAAKRPARSLDPMAAREGALADIAQGRVRDVRLRQVDPARCRMWRRHNRLYDLLTPENCADLIGSIRAQGRQEVPAVVRRVEDDPDHDYEVISGARRHYSVSHLRQVEHRREITFLVEVRDLADEEAFRFSDLENRTREDISDYERGREYLAALEAYYEGNLTRMAARMEMSKGTLSSYLSVARLPDVVLAAYGDPREIAVRHGQMLNPLLRGEASGKERGGVIARAGIIAEQQEKLRAQGLPPLPGAEVIRLLKGEGGKRASDAPRGYGEHEGRPVLTARRKGRRLLLDVDARAGEAAVLAAVREALVG